MFNILSILPYIYILLSKRLILFHFYYVTPLSSLSYLSLNISLNFYLLNLFVNKNCTFEVEGESGIYEFI